MKKNLRWHHGFCAVDQVYLHDVTMKWCRCCFILWNHVVNGDDVTNIWCHCCVVFLSLGCCKHKLCAKLWIVMTSTAKGWAVVHGMVWFLCPNRDTDQKHWQESENHWEAFQLQVFTKSSAYREQCTDWEHFLT